jgi:ketosteroid isomerase-like protein
MSGTRTLVGSLAILAFVAGCQSQAPEFSEAEAAGVRANIEAYARTGLANDWEAWGETLAPDVVFMPPNEPPRLGREAAVAFARAFPKITSLTITPEEVTGRGDLAYARGKYSYAATLADGQAISDSGSFLQIHRRQADGAWLYTEAIWHADSPSPPAPEAAPTAASSP